MLVSSPRPKRSVIGFLDIVGNVCYKVLQCPDTLRRATTRNSGRSQNTRYINKISTLWIIYHQKGLDEEILKQHNLYSISRYKRNTTKMSKVLYHNSNTYLIQAQQFLPSRTLFWTSCARLSLVWRLREKFGKKNLPTSRPQRLHNMVGHHFQPLLKDVNPVLLYDYRMSCLARCEPSRLHFHVEHDAVYYSLDSSSPWSQSLSRRRKTPRRHSNRPSCHRKGIFAGE